MKLQTDTGQQIGIVDPDAGTLVVPLLARPSRSRWTGRRVGGSALKHAVLITIGLTFAFPLVWMILTSLKPVSQAIAFPVVWWPHPVLFSNYPQALTSLPFGRFFLNTVFYAVVTIVGVCVLE